MWAALLANPPNATDNDEQQHQVLHATRPKITSSTKREPA
jgi:hypothetical protein